MRIASSCIVAIAIAMARPASAQEAEAEMLFREGKRLMEQHRVAEACDKFEASERIDPQFGVQFNLAECRELNGQTATAWAMFAKAAATAKHSKRDDAEKRAADARRRATALEKRLVSLTIQVPADRGLEDLVIKRNDMPIDRALWDQPVPVDPADYVISAEAPGYTSWSETVVVKAKSKVIEVPKLERKHEVEHDPGTTTVPTDEPRPHRKPRPKPPAPERQYRTATIALTAVGIGTVVIGTGFALYADHLESQSDAVCPTTACTDSHAVDLNRIARVDGWVANISWGLGAAALGGALAAYLLGNPDRADAVSIAPVVTGDRAGVALEGRF
jgi:hypothetical protein